MIKRIIIVSLKREHEISPAMVFVCSERPGDADHPHLGSSWDYRNGINHGFASEEFRPVGSYCFWTRIGDFAGVVA